MSKIIPVFFTADNAFITYLSSALSAIKGASDPTRRYRAVILHEDLSSEAMARISALASEGFEITFERISDRLGTAQSVDCSCDAMSIYYRLLIPRMFPEYDKGIYVDADTAVCCDLSALFDRDMGEELIGAYASPSLIDVPEFTTYMDDSADVSGFEYVDTGVLLLNLSGLRECGFERLFFTCMPDALLTA